MRLRIRIRNCQPPAENPRDKLVRLSTAIDSHFNEETATPTQRVDLANLIAAMAAIKEAQDANRPKFIILTRVGLATGLCEAYVSTYHVPVPDPA